MNANRAKRIAVNIAGMLCAFAIMLAGVLLPALLLKKQEEKLLGSEWINNVVSVASGGEQYSSPYGGGDADAETAVRQSRLRAVLTAASDGGERYPRDPVEGELMITEAVARARAEMETLFGLGALPAIGMNEFGFRSAELLEENISPAENISELHITQPFLSPIGIWHVTFICGRESIDISIDARTGTALRLSVISARVHGSPDIDSMLMGFVKYYFGGVLGSFQGYGNGRDECAVTICGFRLALTAYKSADEGAADAMTLITFEIDVESGQSMGEKETTPLPTAFAEGTSGLYGLPRPTREPG